ncbi:hypothetical protein B0H17DRAFT_406975 [Mycena rosella]|uniref:Uncharacterized protein n=1 Tax=Mycena rosella TaxID=1033263 RepID=A0AAD7DNV2_MYCRO|nr:hypothetical protein B0H17DRAFT_406975 [Mycena rosella]
MAVLSLAAMLGISRLEDFLRFKPFKLCTMLWDCSGTSAALNTRIITEGFVHAVFLAHIFFFPVALLTPSTN